MATLHSSGNLYDGSYTMTSVTVTIAAAIALYNALELFLLILITFRKFSGLYFWSLVVATIGVVGYISGALVLYFHLTAQLVGLAVRVLCWPAMVTGQSLVLYSRLSVVMGRGYGSLLRAVKWMVIINGAVNPGVPIILTFGAYYASPGPVWLRGLDTEHKIQRTWFTIQECILSGLYIWRALAIVRTSSLIRGRKQAQLVMWQLVSINIIILILDVFILVDEFTTLQAVNQAVKAMIYSVKPKLEFPILGKLSDVLSDRHSSSHLIGPHPDRKRLSMNSMQAQARKTSSSLIERLGVTDRSASGDVEKGVYNIHEASIAELKAFTEPVEKAQPNGQLTHSQPILTLDERRRRSTLDNDLYAGACRDLVT